MEDNIKMKIEEREESNLGKRVVLDFQFTVSGNM